MCVQSLDLGSCLSFSVYPLGASAFDRVSTKTGANLSGQNPARIQEEAGKEEPALTHRRGGVAPSPLPPRPCPLPAPCPPVACPLSPSGLTKGYASWSGPAAAPPLWPGISQWIRRHTGLPLEWAGSKERTGDGEWLPSGGQGGHCPGPRLGGLGGVWGPGDLRRQRHVEFLRQCSQE